MRKNKIENAVIKSLILLHLSKKLLRCEKVQKLKWHFPNVLLLPQEYLIKTQVQLVSALAVMHNFIHLFDPKDKELNKKHMPQETSNNTVTDSKNRPRDDQGDALKHRDDIVWVMWRDYKARSYHR